ncbi:hypothetical protein [Streptomyces camelliae]|uniref:Tn3 transposase DDE domain-containing protein n=1 Tax=Streptomyces camelliae TaxID=3004093 RepID=A0ABY7P604_9ACTN|nr:hypothetical protein [Streptomyces sp. HUAS 2-6]WBO64954.1 hypothetical protein O1G22_20015 [Streptomyces sp. HUAS 2-6]
MLLRLAYFGVTNAFAMLRLLAMSGRDKDVEILALRHQITVLDRRLGKKRGGSTRVIGHSWRPEGQKQYRHPSAVASQAESASSILVTRSNTNPQVIDPGVTCCPDRRARAAPLAHHEPAEDSGLWCGRVAALTFIRGEVQ